MIKTYDKYKDSGVEWIGEIPEHWEVKRLKYLAQAKPSNIDKKTINDEKEIFLCNYLDVYKNDFITNEIDFMKATASDVQIEKFIIKKGDVIATKDSESADDIGIAAYVNEDFENVVCGYHLTHIKPKDIDGEFLFRFFQTKFAKSYFEISANGVTRYALGIEDFNDFQVLLPASEEQKAISKFIRNKTSEIDRIISNKQKLIALYEKEKQAIINQAVTKGLDPNVKMKDSGVEWLGDIPEHWEVKKLKYIAKIKTGYTPSKNEESNYSEDGIVWAKPDNLNEFEPISDSKEKISNEGLKPQNIVAANSVLVCCIGSIGKFGVAGVDLVTNQQINSVTFKNTIIPHFGKYLIYSSKNEHIKEANGNVVRILNSESQSRIIFAIPSLKEQSLIVEFIENEINRLETIISKFNKQIDLLQEYRNTLISEVVTGKIKV